MNQVRFENLKLLPHPRARSQAVASRHIRAGSLIISIPAFASCLLDGQKRRRCDACLRLPDGKQHLLKMCTSCASYYYCDAKCQLMHWQLNHKRVCKIYNRLAALPELQPFRSHTQMDTILLCHFLAQLPTSTNITNVKRDTSSTLLSDDPITVFFSLLPSLNITQPIVNALSRFLTIQTELVQEVYSRFSNNNFTVDSHLRTIANGVFPAASRLFNHSCMANAAPRYILTRGCSVTMEVVALQDIHIDEEICLPYLDPALTQSRANMLQYMYGFTCQCSSCISLRRFKEIPSPPYSTPEFVAIAKDVRLYCGVNRVLGQDLPEPSLANLPESLWCALHEDFISMVSGQFMNAAHEGAYDLAIENGLTLLAIYLLIYPKNYPQIGLHLLELAKTRWNAMISSNIAGPNAERHMNEIRADLEGAGKILLIYGKEGDGDGPFDEINKLDALLNEPGVGVLPNTAHCG